jgi:MraZ protein
LTINGEIEQMFLGQYTHSLDPKGRLSVPARFRELLEPGAYITQGFEQNLMVLTASAFERLSTRVNEMSMTDPTARQLKRLLFATADRVEVDSSGRIRIPQFLREVAGLNGEAVIVGVGDYFEIWSSVAWQPKATELQDTEANAQRFAALELSS